MDRQKRPIVKPTRYQTTSSEEEPPKRKGRAVTSSTIPGTVDDDINDIARIMQQKENSTIPNIQKDPTQRYTPQIHTDAYTNIQTHTNTFSDTTCTPHIQTHAGYTSHAQKHTNIDYSPHIQTQDILHRHTGYSAQTHKNTEYTPLQTHTNTQSFTLHTDRDKTYFTNDTLSQFQNVTPTMNVTQPEAGHQQRGHEGYAVYHAQKTPQKETTNKSKIEELEKRLDNMEAMMKKMDGTLQKILKCVQDRHSATPKPRGVPISTMEQMDAFENIDEQTYSETVNYLHYVGGFNLKEAVHMCLKEVLSDAFAQSFTWFGREEGRRPLYNTRLARAIYDAVCRNRHFHKPTRSEFQKDMREALRTTKERYRQRTRGPRPRGANQRMGENLWNNESEEEDMEAAND